MATKVKNSKRQQSPKRAAARAASRARGVKRHEENRAKNVRQHKDNLVVLETVPVVLLSSVRTTYGPTSKRPGKPKRASKVLRAVHRATDPAVAERRKAHRAAS